MRKYIALARAALLDAVQEKAEIMIWVLLDTIPVFIMVPLWLANQEKLPVMTISQIVTYYVVVMIIGRVTEFYFDEEMSDQVRSGEFSKFLLRPLRFPFAFIPQTFGRKLFSGVTMIIPMLIIIIGVFHRYLVIPTLPGLLFFIPSLFITIGIRYTLSALAAVGAFFWEQSEALTHARWILEIVAGGYMLPLSLYPEWLRIIPDSLPFKYVYYVPVSIFTGAFDLRTTFINLMGGAIWLVILLVLTRWTWKKGLIRYSGVGG